MNCCYCENNKKLRRLPAVCQNPCQPLLMQLLCLTLPYPSWFRIKGQLFLMLQCFGEKHHFYYPLFCKKNMVLKPSNVKNNVSSIKFPVMMLETIVSNISCIF